MEALNPTALLLVQSKLLSLDQAYHYQQEADIHASRLLPYLIQHTQLCSNAISQLLAEHYAYPWIDLNLIDLEHIAPFTHFIPIIRQHAVLAINREPSLIWVIDDPNQTQVLKDIQFLMQCPIHLTIGDSRLLESLRTEFLRHIDQQGLRQYLNPCVSNVAPYLDPQDEKPILSFVYRLLNQAITLGATDLHFESYTDYFRIRYRLDGHLQELARPMPFLAPRIASCLKIMANLNMTEKRLPQDGRFSFKLTADSSLDCRINTCPTTRGEKIAIRFLNKPSSRLALEDLVLSQRDHACFLQAIQKTQGLVLITGPTGSGKTITLYATLSHLNTLHKHILTIEDPVELDLPDINQVQIDSHLGFNFPEALRAFLRQDPDIIMIGEIRDYPTADIAMKAAQTGHLVLATLHTQNCVQTLIRLKQLGIAPYLMAHISLIVSQRLIRVLCSYCKKPSANSSIYTAQGCHRCHQGYKGRQAIFEIMPISFTLQERILQSKWCPTTLSNQAIQDGMLTLRQAGLQKVEMGITTLEEIDALI